MNFKLKNMAFLVVPLTFIGATCQQAAQVTADVIDVVDAVCTKAQTQPDPAWVYFVCTVAGAAGDTAPTFTTKIPAAAALGMVDGDKFPIATLMSRGYKPSP
jgi:hypothetical protein